MHRTIKFRAWTGKTMMYQEKQYLGSFLRRVVTQIMLEHGSDEPREHESYLPKGTVIDDYLLQFTGLLDKNGKEIYEHDMVLMEGTAKGYIVYSGAGWCVRANDPMLNLSLNETAPEFMEVIGNIHETQVEAGERMTDERHPPHKYCLQCKQWRDADDTHCSKCGLRLVLKHLNEPEEA